MFSIYIVIDHAEGTHLMPTPTITYTSTDLLTSVVTITTTITASNCPMVQQQNEVSSNDNNCDIIVAIVVPTVLVFTALTVIICISVVVVMRVVWKRRKGEDDITKNGNHITCMVENDLYQLVSNCIIAIYSYIIHL